MLDLHTIRNFCIIAHIDHGKSTLADRFLEITQTIDRRVYKDKKQILDTMDLEQERGITIKLQPVRMEYQGYIFNLIDTPGHVDFTYEVSRSLAACEGALLVVDATQGIEAQTLANYYLALEQNLDIIPVVNKIDLPSAKPDRVAKEIEKILGIPIARIVFCSAKSGEGVAAVLERVITDFRSPTGVATEPLKALIFDSAYDSYKGVVAYVRLVDGCVRQHDKLLLMARHTTIEALEIGVFKPNYVPVTELRAGEVGYIATGLKSVSELAVGDTITRANHPAASALPGYKRIKPMVFAGLYPVEGDAYGQLREALQKLKLSDAALFFEPEHSSALGNGFRCGFLGLLHLEIVQERLEREYNLDLITTAPSVRYLAKLYAKRGMIEEREINAAGDFPEATVIESVLEPWIALSIIAPSEYIGSIMELVTQRRGMYQNTEYFDETRVNLIFEIPLSEILTDFYHELKSISAGYASMDYEFLDYRQGDLVKVDTLVAGERVEAMSVVVPRSRSQYIGKNLVKKLKTVIPRQLFEVSVQAAIGGKIIARENIPAMRKDVIAKLYGGDVTRKRKLLEKQKKGKRRMKHVGRVDLPQEAFMAILKLGEK